MKYLKEFGLVILILLFLTGLLVYSYTNKNINIDNNINEVGE